MTRKIAVVMGSDSDYGILKAIIPILQENNIDYDFRVISAHRTPEIAAEFAKNAKGNGYDLIIAGAGMSAHLAGVLASFTGVPIIGVPIKSDLSGMDGMDALHSVIQMPPGIPVAAVGIDNASGAAQLAVKMVDCFPNTAVCTYAAPIVQIIYEEKAVGQADLEKAIHALEAYGIGYEVSDLANIGNEGIEGLKLQERTFAVLNFTDINIEKTIEKQRRENKVPIVTVPLKAVTKNFNDTSNKLYNQTNGCESVAFVGVHAYQNGAHLIGRIAGIHHGPVYEAVVKAHSKLAAAVIEKDAKIYNEVNREKPGNK